MKGTEVEVEGTTLMLKLVPVPVVVRHSVVE